MRTAVAGRVLCSLDSVDGLRSRTTVLGKLSAVVARDSRGFESRRGYTGHEMMGEFGLVNMNGRLYDPTLGRFLSPDNYV